MVEHEENDKRGYADTWRRSTQSSITAIRILALFSRFNAPRRDSDPSQPDLRAPHRVGRFVSIDAHRVRAGGCVFSCAACRVGYVKRMGMADLPYVRCV